MNINRRDFLTACGAFAATSAVARPVRDILSMQGMDGEIVNPSASDYVLDGAFAFWDSIENIGFGEHDPESTNWVDLISGRRFTGCAFDDDTACIVQSNRACSFNGPFFNRFSCELVCARVPGTGQNHSLQSVQYVRKSGQSSAQGFSAQRYPSNNRQYIAMMNISSALTTSVPEDICHLAATYEYNEGVGVANYYCNGLHIKTQAVQAEMEFYSTTIYNYLSPNNRFYRISLYDRVLGADEIADNYDIDRRRFGL